MTVMTIELDDGVYERLVNIARDHGLAPEELAARQLSEALSEAAVSPEFAALGREIIERYSHVLASEHALSHC